jgi:hypothetical protein
VYAPDCSTLDLSAGNSNGIVIFFDANEFIPIVFPRIRRMIANSLIEIFHLSERVSGET